ASYRRRDQRHRRRVAWRQHGARFGRSRAQISGQGQRWRVQEHDGRARRRLEYGAHTDVPKVSRVAGLGIIKLASATGRPIFPVALATSRRIGGRRQSLRRAPPFRESEPWLSVLQTKSTDHRLSPTSETAATPLPEQKDNNRANRPRTNILLLTPAQNTFLP